jgi:hypothetical protein
MRYELALVSVKSSDHAAFHVEQSAGRSQLARRARIVAVLLLARIRHRGWASEPNSTKGGDDKLGFRI